MLEDHTMILILNARSEVGRVALSGNERIRSLSARGVQQHRASLSPTVILQLRNMLVDRIPRNWVAGPVVLDRLQFGVSERTLGTFA
jgi:hypothetical protein